MTTTSPITTSGVTLSYNGDSLFDSDGNLIPPFTAQVQTQVDSAPPPGILEREKFGDGTDDEGTDGLPSAPTNFRITGQGPTYTDVDWDPPSSNEPPVFNYRVRQYTGGSCRGEADEFSTGDDNNQTEMRVDGSEDTEHSFKVRGVNDVGAGPFSPCLGAGSGGITPPPVPPGSPGSGTAPPPPGIPEREKFGDGTDDEGTDGLPSAPTNFRITGQGPTYTDVDWDPPSSNEPPVFNYRVRQYTGGSCRGEADEFSTGDDNNQTEMRVDGSEDTEHSFKVRGVNDVGAGPFSPCLGAGSGGITPPPVPPGSPGSGDSTPTTTGCLRRRNVSVYH